MSADS
jgi:hypothetical protein